MSPSRLGLRELFGRKLCQLPLLEGVKERGREGVGVWEGGREGGSGGLGEREGVGVWEGGES